MTFLKSATAALVLGCALAAHAADGLVAVKSPHSAADTGSRLVAAVQARGLKLFVCIDLPLKALVWQDDKGQVWSGYNDPAWMAARHGASSCAIVPNLAKVLAGLAGAATAP